VEVHQKAGAPQTKLLIHAVTVLGGSADLTLLEEPMKVSMELINSRSRQMQCRATTRFVCSYKEDRGER
jgi:hypothetical protein